MKPRRRSRDLAIALAAGVVAVACVVALSVVTTLQHSRIAASLPYLSGGPGMMMGGPGGMMGQSGMMRPGRSPALPSCSVPALPGTLVDVTLADMHGMMGGPGMMGRSGMMGGPFPNGNQDAPMGMMGGMMRIAINPATVPPGQVSFRVTNNGALNHELVILPPLARGQYPGQRAVGPDGTVGEAGSVGGEASRTCGADKGDENTDNPGIAPGGGSGWTTVNLTPGRYELICNISGHYWTGMYAELDVSPTR